MLKEEANISFIYPSLHEDVAAAVSHEIGSTWFHQDGNESSCDNEYSTFVTGNFECNSYACSKSGWSSGKVTIHIMGFPGNGYTAVVFNQRCKSCRQLGIFTLNEQSYVDRVTYRLKKWAGVSSERRIYFRKETPPHRRDLCEGCKRGVCEETKLRMYR
ncbi:hypothetical protein K505DRAFT_244534 [Melanomma pulvis-pyrius CBS 109.77]|uniref:3CxxC-type domain-containing protein n=1 Tax=Melanomma pulvis-pyrius CBS 109.77 TaxID=1314802 RepID=A0A6A6XAI8_9PLEO|nr:hypothetical protein K505DRAFT_244534 [Melanomma pulvis-pyrius CBS 109.77]